VPRYEAFLLRVWRGTDRSDGQCALRLEHLPDGQSLRFSDPDLLLAHLRAIICSDAPSSCLPRMPEKPPTVEHPRARSSEEGTGTG
jgi:hypothetical protein